MKLERRYIGRSLAFFCVGVVLCACSHSDPIVAHVGDQTIKASELKFRYNQMRTALPNDATTRKRILDAVINEKVIAALAEKAGTDPHDFTKRLLSKELAVSNQEAAAYYNTHPKEFPHTSFAQAKVSARGAVQLHKYEAWLQKVKSSVPVQIDEAAVNSVNLSK